MKLDPGSFSLACFVNVCVPWVSGTSAEQLRRETLAHGFAELRGHDAELQVLVGNTGWPEQYSLLAGLGMTENECQVVQRRDGVFDASIVVLRPGWVVSCERPPNLIKVGPTARAGGVLALISREGDAAGAPSQVGQARFHPTCMVVWVSSMGINKPGFITIVGCRC